jgi:hypothetical protein
MTHDELLRAIRLLGCHLRRRSESHDIYVNPSTGRKACIPRQEEICDELASLIKNHLEEAIER